MCEFLQDCVECLPIFSAGHKAKVDGPSFPRTWNGTHLNLFTLLPESYCKLALTFPILPFPPPVCLSASTLVTLHTTWTCSPGPTTCDCCAPSSWSPECLGILHTKLKCQSVQETCICSSLWVPSHRLLVDIYLTLSQNAGLQRS